MRRNLSVRNLALFVKDDDDDGANPGGGGGPSKETKLTALRAKYNGDLERAMGELYEVNERFTRQNAKLTATNEELKVKLPAGGTVVLDAEQAKQWEAYQKLGKPEGVVAKTDLDTANAKLAELDVEKLHHAAAKELTWKPSITHDLAKDKALHVEIKDEVENGKPVKRVYARPKADEKAPLILLSKLVETTYADYLPALRTVAPVVIPGQTSAEDGNPASGGLAEKHIQNREARGKARTNPLSTGKLPAATT